MLNLIKNIFATEMKIIFRHPFISMMPLLFFTMMVSLLPFSLGTDIEILKKFAPMMIWLSALLAILLSMPNLFRYDVEDHFIDTLLLSPYPLSFIVLIKILCHWIFYCLPLLLLSPLFSALFNIDYPQKLALFFSLLLGTPALCLLGAVGAALVVSLRHASLLLPLLILPLYVPVLIFSTASMTNVAISGYLALLAALSLFYLAFCPWLAAAALRIGVQ